MHELRLFNKLADALGLPEHVSKMSLHFAVDEPTRLQVEMMVTDEDGKPCVDDEGVVYELQHYTLVRNELPRAQDGMQQETI